MRLPLRRRIPDFSLKNKSQNIYHKINDAFEKTLDFEGKNAPLSPV